MVNVLRNGCMCVLKYIVDVKQLLDKNLKYKHHIIPVLSNSFENSILDGLLKISNFQATLNARFSHINSSMYTILVFLRACSFPKNWSFSYPY